MVKKLDSIELEKQLANLTGWKLSENQIEKEFTLNNFAEVLSLVNKIGAKAEELDHHPDMLIHGWNKLKIMISTHSAGGLTVKDFELASMIERLV